MKKAAIAIFLLAIVFFAACKKTKTYWFGGLQIVDTNGKLERWVGQPDDDWLINKYSFTDAQNALFNFNANPFPYWGTTAVGNVTVSPGTDPVGLDTSKYAYYSFVVTADTNCVVSYVVTDQHMNILFQGNTFLYSGSVLYIPVQIPSSYLQAGQAYRLYYAFSAEGNLYFAKGWGDFGVCTETDGHISTCF